jgi:hypothetical protein
MTCADFLSLLSCIASPLLKDENGSVILPIIWDSQDPEPSLALKEIRKERQKEFMERINNLRKISEIGENVPYVEVGRGNYLKVKVRIVKWCREESTSQMQQC